MKRIEIKLAGAEEERVAQEVLTKLYESVQKHGYMDISIQTQSNDEKFLPIREETTKELQVPSFFRGGISSTGKIYGSAAVQAAGR